MTLTEEQIKEIAQDEDNRWKTVHRAVVKEMGRATGDMHNDRELARDLTAELVAAYKDEDKAALASDEAVAHGLCSLRKDISEDYTALAKQPYFARVVTEEEDRNVEFRLGTASFPDQRIVDWRKAPISKLYYNYKEGEFFDEEIQGRDREGTIKLRRSYKGFANTLNAIELPEGVINRQNGSWSYDGTEAPLSRSSGHDGHLPPILSLITSDQFDLITHDAKRPVIIQGIAGSGKTTVALHRLAWLLHEDNSDAKPENCMVIVFNRALKTYIETTLPELGIEGVVIKTYNQWLNKIAVDLAGPRKEGNFKKTREAEQFKSSPTCLNEVFKYVSENKDYDSDNYEADLFNFYKYICAKDILWPRWNTIKEQLLEQTEKGLRDVQDDSILLNLIFAREGYYPCKSASTYHMCDHIVIDEAQDFGVMEVRALLNALDIERTVSIVGDAAQKIVMNRHFGGWEELLREAGFGETTPIELTVSHRTTQEVMEVAAYIQSDIHLSESEWSALRPGPEPTIIRADNYEVQPHVIGKWMKERMEEDPHSLSAVICRWPKQAERLTQHLRKIGYPFVRWGHRENFDFSPGITITSVHQVKGLEFRNVLIVNPTEQQFSQHNEEEKNLLYVAVTRAEVKLDFTTVHPATNMLPEMHTI